MKTAFVATVFTVSTALLSPASAADYRWTQGFGQGTTEAIIQNRNGGNLNIYCPAGSEDTTPGLILETNLVKVPKGQTLDIQIVVDGNNHPFGLDDKMAYLAAGRGFRANLDMLVAALRKSKAKAFIVEYPQSGKSEAFSLLNARQALSSGNASILADCN